MDVRCERCRAQYVFDDDQVTPAGLTVQCTNCGHLFRVKKKEMVVTVAVKPDEITGPPLPASSPSLRTTGPIAAGAPGAPVRPSSPKVPAAAATPLPEAPPREWRIRQASGNTFTFRELTTLQKWIIERKVGRDDEISRSGEQWKRLGDIAELASFFQVVEAAERSRTLDAMPHVTSMPFPHLTPASMQGQGAAAGSPTSPPPPPSGYPPPSFAAAPSPSAEPASAFASGSSVDASGSPPTFELPPAHDVDVSDVDVSFDDEAPPVRARSSSRPVLVLAAVLVLGGGGAALLAQRLLRTPAPAPTALELPPAATPAPARSPAPAAELPPPSPTEAETTTQTATQTATATPTEAGTTTQTQTASATPTASPTEAGTSTQTSTPTATADQAAPAAKSPKALLARAKALQAKGSVAAALELFGRLLSEDPGNVEAQAGRGLCYLDLEKWAPAEASFQAALRLRPDHAVALLGLAETYRFQGKKGEAIPMYERYLARHPDGEEAQVAKNALAALRE